MNDETTDPIDVPEEMAQALGAMTRWEGEQPAAWKAALDAARLRRWSLTRRLPTWVSVAAVLVIAGIALMLALPTVQQRVAPVSSPAPLSTNAFEQLKALDSPAHWRDSDRGDEKRFEGSETMMFGLAGGVAPAAPALRQTSSPDTGERQVIRKANIDLKARDVRSVFLKANQILSEARGEYVEQSSLTGTGESLQASVTLRVAADRLSDVLNQVRGLATVVSESSGGEDVTAQVVDLEARLKNEQRVEAELLGLMEARKDAPLKDVLELRESISRIRENIERMTAQRERLGRLVSLATVLVIINPDTTKPAPLPEGLGTYFLKQIRGAWQTALELLADSIAFLIRVVVGGAFFWILAAGVIAVILALRRRMHRKGGAEAAPRLA